MANEFRDETRPEALAFPMSYPSNEMYIHQGLSKREYFAAMAMQGYLSGEMFMRQSREEISAKSVMAADALIEALNK